MPGKARELRERGPPQFGPRGERQPQTGVIPTENVRGDGSNAGRASSASWSEDPMGGCQ